MLAKRLMSAALALTVAGASAHAADGMKKGTPDWMSAGALAFGPDGLLFVGDSQGGAIYAVATGDQAAAPAGEAINLAAVNEKLAGLLGIEPRELLINDVAVNPASGAAYLSASRGRGPDAAPVLARVDRSGKLDLVSTDDVSYSKATLTRLPAAAAGGAPPAGAARKKGSGASPRSQAITDLAFVDGRVYVAGLSNEEFSSRLVSIPYPFAEVNDGTSVEIYHGAHGQYETRSPVRTFAAYKIHGEPHLLAAYTCTPLVKFPVGALQPGAKFRGTTVAELGNRNTPLDMVVYRKGGKDFATVDADETSPDPKSWTITPPRAGTREPLVVRFGDTLDRATVASNVALLGPDGAEVDGTPRAEPDGTGWRLTPARPWAAGAYQLAVNPDLEDLAGNSVRRPFEVDVQRDVPAAPAAELIRLPVRVAP